MDPFDQWYSRTHGRAPFPWQSRLADMVVHEVRFPDALALPTGTGKTAIIAVWAWARAQGLRVPTRLVYVIDRRIVVDSIGQYADELAGKMPEEVRPRVVRMRGGMPIDEAWVRDPRAPAIIVSTVDQVGSRLLFRGYGVSSRAAPIHAALLGEDALVVVDEAHLSQPFVATLQRIAQAPRPLGLPWQPVIMSATPPAGVRETFTLDAADLAHPVLSRRLTAAKPARLSAAPDAEFAAAVAMEAERLRAEGAGVVGVVVNRVADARAAFESLRRSGDAVLLTGRIRPADRDALLETYLPRMLTGSRSAGRPPLYVVATQTIEVGADLDFDALVTESAPLSALRQRVGRLNRLGELDHSPAAIVHRQRAKGAGVDRVYGDALPSAWKWLGHVAKAKMVDFGVLAFDALAAADAVPEEPVPGFPTLTPAVLDALSCTSPRFELDVGPFLHGWEDARADVQLVWRADLGDPERWAASVQAVPPVLGEMMAVPLYEARGWLGVDGPDSGRQVLRWDAEQSTVVPASRIRPGDVLVVPADYGGADAYGWAPKSEATVTDVGDVSTGRRWRLRLNPAVHPELSDLLSRGSDEDIPWQDALRAMGADEALVARASVSVYPAGLIVEAGLWDVERVIPRAVPLDRHLDGVRRWGERLAKGLAPDLVAVVGRACALHDVGKADARFQLMLGARPGEKLAKSAVGPDRARLLRRLSGLPEGWRHEMESVARRSDEPDLVRYLIGTHHGYGRPELPAAPDPDLWLRAGGDRWADLCGTLETHWGLWGLAYLSALVRLADWCRSEEEQTTTDGARTEEATA